MAFLRNLSSVVSDLAQKVGRSPKPYDVREINKEAFSKCPEMAKADSLTLYKLNNTFVAVLFCPQHSHKVFSLFQLVAEDDAYAQFSNLSMKLYPLYESAPEVLCQESLQICVTTLVDHPTWSCMHLGVKLKFIQSFKHPRMKQYINVQAEDDQTTALHIAIKQDNLAAIEELLLCGAKLDIFDKRGNSVYHYAAEYASPDIIKILSSKDKSTVNQANNDGLSPLHVACMEKKADNLEILLRSGANPCISASNLFPIHCAVESDSVKCIEVLLGWEKEKQLTLRTRDDGNTVLHLCQSKEAVDRLVKVSCCRVDVRNANGLTPLHMAMMKGHRSMAMALLICGADAALETADGSTCLHLAVQADCYELAQCAIVFGADVNKINLDGQTARHMAATSQGDNSDHLVHAIHNVGGDRCQPGTLGCNEGCSTHGKLNGKAKGKVLQQTEHHKQLYDRVIERTSLLSAQVRANSNLPSTAAAASPGLRVLCLDGGGIRGLILIKLLLAIEKASRKPAIELFDWIAGTSTGAILALGIATGKTARQVLGLYFQLKDEVFKGRRPYESEPLEQFMKSEFGEHKCMDDITGLKVVVTGVLGDRVPSELHLFRNYEIPGLDYDQLKKTSKFELPPRPQNQYVWRAARSSGAAPTYFRAFGRFLDGGLIANNPSLDILTEIHDYNIALKAVGRGEEVLPIHVLVSLGTGKLPLKKVDAVDVYRPEGLTDLYRTVMGAKNLAEILIEAATQSEGRAVERTVAWCSTIGVPFFRLSPELTQDVALDCRDDAILIDMLWETECYITNNWTKIATLAKLLASD